jgi:MerR family mercuric resistance operon transcriptional regulator
MNEPQRSFAIGALAEAAKVGVETIRFYQRRGLLIEPVKPHGGIRRYVDGDISRVRFIKSAQRLGFSLDEIASLLTLEDGRRCSEARTLAADKLGDVRQRIADLRSIEVVLSDLVARCGDARGRVTCPLIQALHREADPPRMSTKRAR